MAPTLTVHSVRSAERNRIKAALSTLTHELTSADAGLAAAQADRVLIEGRLGEVQRIEADLRRRIAAEQMSADIHQLEVELEENLLAQRPLLADLAAAQNGVAILERTRQRAAAAQERVRSLLNQADAALLLAEQEDDALLWWRKELSGPVLDALLKTAGSPAVTAEVTAAKDRLAELLGSAKFVDLLTSRLADAAGDLEDRGASLARAVDALDTLHTRLASRDGTVLSAATAFDRIRNQVRAVVEGGATRLAEARRVLALAAQAPNLTDAQNARITTRKTDALKDAPSPVDKETAVHDAAVSARRSAAEFDAKALIEEAKDPEFDRDDPANLIPERKARDDSQAALDKAVQEFKPADKAAIDLWEVAVPRAVMTLAAQALRAVAAVAELKGVKLNGSKGLLESLDKAETDYAGALQAQLADRVNEGLLATLVEERLDLRDALAPVADQRLVSFILGDA
jgi:chromosome segregation ATPase